MRKINREKWKEVVTGSPAMRKAICKDDPLGPLYFAMYYFTEYFTYKTPPFHMEMYEDCKALTDGTVDEIMWCVHRDGAKTSIAKIALLIWCICFQKKSYVGWDSYDSENAESALFDVTVALQKNEKLIADFGHLYYKKQSKQALSEAKMKRIKNFITEPSQYGPGVKVVTFSTQESIRGRITGHERLDLVIFDDFENNKTKDSAPVTKKVIDHINEYRSGMPAGASVLYLCNYITDTGSVANVMENLRGNSRARIRFVPVKNEKGEISWPDKFVETRKEADELNKEIADPKLHKLSLEAKKEALSKDGLTYETEMMLNPAKSGDLFFDRKKVDQAIARAIEPLETNADLKIWAKFNPKHRYGGGADTAEGIGGDHNASAWIDFTQNPNLVVATFQDNQMSNTVFGWELKRQGALYGYPYLVPEINNTGYGTVSELLNAEYPLIYQREVRNKTTQKMQKEYGWRASIGTKFQVLGQFKEAFESGDLEILDKALLEEMKVFTKAAARIIGREKDATRHYDKLRAAALAWEANKWAPLAAVDKKALYTVPGQNEPYRP